MTAPSTFRFSLACGVAGAYVDVTDDVLFEEGPVPFTDGRISEFDGFNPGVFSFTLGGAAGEYTPGNTASTLATPLTEGMGAVIEIDALKLSGTVRSAVLLFPADPADPVRVRVTCDDMLGDAARHIIDNLYDDAVNAGEPYFWWPMDDDDPSLTAAERTGLSRALVARSGSVRFGAVGVAGLDRTQVALGEGSAGGVLNSSHNTGAGIFSAIPYDNGSMGWWSAWVSADTTSNELVGYSVWYDRLVLSNASFTATVQGGTGRVILQIISGTVGGGYVSNFSAAGLVPVGVPVHLETGLTTTFAAGQWTVTATVYLNGVSAVSADFITDSQTIQSVWAFANAPAAGRISQLAHTRYRTSGYYSVGTSPASLLTAVAQTTPEIALDTLPTLSPAPLLGSTLGGRSTLDALNELMRTEQGYMWVETTGTLLAPVPKIQVAARNRERAVDYTFDVSEILDPIAFIRSLNNTVSQATANGPDASATYRDDSLRPLVGSATTSDSVLLADTIDLDAFASDRVDRGRNRGIAIQAITIDATSPKISRWAALTTIRQGYRLHITGLPSANLGFSTWDGFVVGRQIDNTQDSNTEEPKTFFTFYLSPWKQVYVYDAALSVYDTATYAF